VGRNVALAHMLEQVQHAERRLGRHLVARPEQNAIPGTLHCDEEVYEVICGMGGDNVLAN
jgi:hypothetical protein